MYLVLIYKYRKKEIYRISYYELILTRGEKLKIMLTHARIDPEEPLPSQTVVKLRELRPLARAVRPQFRAKDTQHRFPALRSWTGTLLCHTIHRAILLVVLQFRPKKHGNWVEHVELLVSEC